MVSFLAQAVEQLEENCTLAVTDTFLGIDCDNNIYIYNATAPDFPILYQRSHQELGGTVKNFQRRDDHGLTVVQHLGRIFKISPDEGVSVHTNLEYYIRYINDDFYLTSNEERNYWKVWKNDELQGPMQIDNRPIKVSSYISYSEELNGQVILIHLVACTEQKENEPTRCHFYQLFKDQFTLPERISLTPDICVEDIQLLQGEFLMLDCPSKKQVKVYHRPPKSSDQLFLIYESNDSIKSHLSVQSPPGQIYTVKLFSMVERPLMNGKHLWRVIDQVDIVGTQEKDMSSLTIQGRFSYDSSSMMYLYSQRESLGKSNSTHTDIIDFQVTSDRIWVRAHDQFNLNKQGNPKTIVLTAPICAYTQRPELQEGSDTHEVCVDLPERSFFDERATLLAKNDEKVFNCWEYPEHDWSLVIKQQVCSFQTLSGISSTFNIFTDAIGLCNLYKCEDCRPGEIARPSDGVCECITPGYFTNPKKFNLCEPCENPFCTNCNSPAQPGVCIDCLAPFVLRNSSIPDDAPYDTCYEPIICDSDKFLNKTYQCELIPPPPAPIKIDWGPVFFLINFILAMCIIVMVIMFTWKIKDIRKSMKKAAQKEQELLQKQQEEEAARGLLPPVKKEKKSCCRRKPKKVEIIQPEAVEEVPRVDIGVQYEKPPKENLRMREARGSTDFIPYNIPSQAITPIASTIPPHPIEVELEAKRKQAERTNAMQKMLGAQIISKATVQLSGITGNQSARNQTLNNSVETCVGSPKSLADQMDQQVIKATFACEDLTAARVYLQQQKHMDSINELSRHEKRRYLTAAEDSRNAPDPYEIETEANMRSSLNQTDILSNDDMRETIDPERLVIESFKGELKNYFRSSLNKFKPRETQ